MGLKHSGKYFVFLGSSAARVGEVEIHKVDYAGNEWK